MQSFDCDRIAPMTANDYKAILDPAAKLAHPRRRLHEITSFCSVTHVSSYRAHASSRDPNRVQSLDAAERDQPGFRNLYQRRLSSRSRTGRRRRFLPRRATNPDKLERRKGFWGGGLQSRWEARHRGGRKRRRTGRDRHFLGNGDGSFRPPIITVLPASTDLSYVSVGNINRRRLAGPRRRL